MSVFSRAIVPPRYPEPWDIEEPPQALVGVKVVVGGREESVMVRDPEDCEPFQAYSRPTNYLQPPRTGNPDRRTLHVRVKLPRDTKTPFEVVFSEGEELVLVKRMLKRRGLSPDPALLEVAPLQYFQRLRNDTEFEYVIPCVECLQDQECVYLVMPYKDGDLLTYVTDHRPDERLARNIFCSMLEALTFVQENHVFLGDIKPENILIDEETFRTTFIDVSTSLRVPYELDENGLVVNYKMIGAGRFGTHPNMAPEIFNEEDSFDGFAADIYSLGTVLYHLLTGERLCEEPSGDFYLNKVQGNGLLCDPLLAGFHPEVSVLLKGMLNHDVAQRFTVHEVIQHLVLWQSG